jgi:hypothetical protein
MRHHLTTSFGVAFGVALLAALGPHARAQSSSAKAAAAAKYNPPRTADGHPDFHGEWSFANITPLERPTNLGDKAVLTDAEAAQLEEQNAARSNQDAGRQRGTAADVNRAYNDFWYDRGTRVASTKQTSLVVDPPNGRIPDTTAAAKARVAERTAARQQVRRGPADGPEDRSLAERCLIGFNAGPPFTPSAYNNNIRFVQTPTHVVIEMEMVHEPRIVPLDTRKRMPQGIRQWMGESRGHWEGDTLVVETTNFSDKNQPFARYGATPTLKLTEKFSRPDAGTLLYEYTVTDPATFTRPWTVRIPLEKLLPSEDVYEYACHEANYGMEGILKGTRTEEKSAQK